MARAFGASSRVVVNELREYYNKLHDAQPEPHTPKITLRMTFPYPDSWTGGGVKFTLTYRYHFDKDSRDYGGRHRSCQVYLMVFKGSAQGLY